MSKKGPEGSCWAAAGRSGTLRGALGTELMNKCFETYECKKQEGAIFQVEQTATRKYDIRDKLQFTVSADGLPSLLAATAAAQQVASQSAEQQTDNPYIYYDANNVRKARISTLLRDCLPAGRELPYVQLVEEIERLLGNKLWAEKILASIVQRGGLASRTDERGAVLYRMHGA